MICYSIEPRDKIFVKGYEFSSFSKNMSKDIGKSINKNFSSIYSQKLPDYAKKICYRCN